MSGISPDRWVTVLDGGMGRELLRVGAPFRQPEWSALALMEAPDRVLEAHHNFLRAGADVITANTYAVVPFHIGHERFADLGRELVELAARLARQAADEIDRPVRVAGSIAPLFGSYEPEHFEPESAAELYRPIVEAQAPYVDLWIIETVSSVTEAIAALDAVDAIADASDQPVWLAFCLPDDVEESSPVLRSGEPIADLVGAVSGRVDALLINCSLPESIEAALPLLRRLVPAGLPIGAYANTFAPEPVRRAANSGFSQNRDELTPATYADTADRWIAAGATIVGGCCGIYPDHIAELAARRSAERSSPSLVSRAGDGRSRRPPAAR
jgi:S-methylmethionine-dependent homocysteine/selenocysteine methylase